MGDKMTATVLRYPLGSLLADYGRGALGLALTVPVVAFVDPAPIVFWLFALCAAISALFVARTALRQVTALTYDDTGVWQSGPWRRRIAWDELTDLRLKFFSTRRDRSVGWMQLTLKGGGRTIGVESTLEDFEALTARAFDAARARDLALGDATLANLLALGIDPEPGPDSLAARWGVTGGALHDPRAGSGG